jgi:hypothetical protein
MLQTMPSPLQLEEKLEKKESLNVKDNSLNDYLIEVIDRMLTDRDFKMEENKYLKRDIHHSKYTEKQKFTIIAECLGSLSIANKIVINTKDELELGDFLEEEMTDMYRAMEIIEIFIKKLIETKNITL